MSQTLVVWYQQQRVGRLIVNGARQMAFVCDGDAVGSKDDPQNLHRNHWDEFSHQLGVSPRLVKRTIESQATRLCDEADNWLNRFREQYGELPALDCIHAIVCRQSIKALRSWL
ncbi:protein HipA [Alcanivorax hongdengensis A-11-3]|uniref:Protein HipA n=1 Tax=Alcanivorax hongdengensis A-11-3 TaxID=1177179 RepID=L0WH01_9GAMM|nr:hypothetical protein [Alcanivorax hongdengensis]EKF75387.1 protein HipA [Alcanivorax hongdengensis A-11-3]